MSVSDLLKDYNPPTLQRKDLMSLSTINEKDVIMKTFKKLNTSRDWSLNLYNLDIDKSTPRRNCVFTNKIDYINRNDDIEKSQCPNLRSSLNIKSKSLSNLDIIGSTPKACLFKTNRCVNPLCPEYKLPSVVEYPPEQTKFIRDSMNIDDLIHSHPRKNIDRIFKNYDHERYKYFIENAKMRRGFDRKSKYDYIDYSDLRKEEFKTSRCINPLDPVYVFNRNKNGTGNESDKISYGPIDNNKPQSFSRYFISNGYNLRNDDIDGTRAGSRNTINRFTGSNSALNIHDIEGTKTGSLKKCSIETSRHINPLWPKYVFPGSTEIKTPVNQQKDCKNEERHCFSPPIKKMFNNKLKLNSIQDYNNINKNINQKSIDINNTDNIIYDKSEIKNDNQLKFDNNKSIDIEKNFNKNDKVISTPIKNEQNINNKENENINKKPKLIFSIPHDQFLVPSMTDRKSEIFFRESKPEKNILDEYKVISDEERNESIRTEQNRRMKLSQQLINKRNKPLSYPEKLDLFMLKNNLKFIEKE